MPRLTRVSEEFKKKVSEYNTGLNQQESHDRAMLINREWLAEKERDHLSYAELGRRHGVTKEMARFRVKRALAERKKEK